MHIANGIDAIDSQLLRLLQEDCKTSLNRLGQAVGLSAPAVMERIRKLEQTGVIRGYHATVDGRKVGLDITAFVGVSINYPKDISSFLATLRLHPEIMECHHVTGGHTLLLKVKTVNTAALETVISALRCEQGVTRTETMIVLSTSEERHQIPVPIDETATASSNKRRSKKIRSAS